MHFEWGKRLVLCLLVLLVAAAAEQANAQDLGQRLGMGFGAGYNAPVSSGYNVKAMCGWTGGCCDVPANWPTHVWDGYMGDTVAWHASWVGVPQAGPLSCRHHQPGQCRQCEMEARAGPWAPGQVQTTLRPIPASK